ncbi:pyruvate dehydrogenase (acetyl-transferring) E1 component subunit alpha [Raineyella sp.]|uniref:pyruvate dehydrogenase (acetyl-transferring) E1 component subunit alpha n=1 Tax=Raineyella sp. TaxID=1911550 RepID=UPI002B1FEDD4|nr:pyruvate dehydrogenase (acetyl-transferring) E1 component subunit alpha [Raineyella sp.]MEA5153469.1 pyruvate dehydrogenase (acetyl-transferring) E1 component subunit alpha [Raineyella sp.]
MTERTANTNTNTNTNDDAGTSTDEQALPVRLLTDMLRVRRMEEKCAELYGASKIRGFLHLYIGEEACAVGTLHRLGPDDNIVATYREHAHALIRGVPMSAIMAEMFGKVTGCCRGRGGSMHLYDATTRFFGGTAIVGSGLPIAAGLGLADRMRGGDAVTACFFGEGAMAEGAFHEAANLAALWQLPVLFCCENNLYAMGTALAHEHARTDLAGRAAVYGMATAVVDGMDVLAVHAAVGEAVASIRAGGGPVFLEMQTYRFRAHSMFDPGLYRTKAEVAAWRERDPIPRLASALREAGLAKAELAALEVAAQAEVSEAVRFAEASSVEPVEALLRDVTTPVGPPVVPTDPAAGPMPGGVLPGGPMPGGRR